MKELATIAAYRSIRARLITPGETWGDKVFSELAPIKTDVPYVLMAILTSGRAWHTKAEDNEPIIVVKVVSNDLTEALALAGRLAEILSDSGAQESSNPLVSGAQWKIASVTRGLDVHYVEKAEIGLLYHQGAQYRLRMERIG
jgi:hypothetical protein